MSNIQKIWTDFKNCGTIKNVSIQMIEDNIKYYLFFQEGLIIYECIIYKDTTNIAGLDITQNNLDKTDFETNYKSTVNQSINPTDEDGKQILRAESRPIGYSTYFSSFGDSDTNIGDGTPFLWDFSNDNDLIFLPSGSDIKTKRIEFSFIDSVFVKEGSLYFQDAPLGSYISLQMVCPADEWYVLNNGTSVQATEDIVVGIHVNRHFMCGTCPMGDELNTETRSKEVPNTYKFRIDVTVPINENICTGYVSIELYRKRTTILE